MDYVYPTNSTSSPQSPNLTCPPGSFLKPDPSWDDPLSDGGSISGIPTIGTSPLKLFWPLDIRNPSFDFSTPEEKITRPVFEFQRLSLLWPFTGCPGRLVFPRLPSVLISRGLFLLVSPFWWRCPSQCMEMGLGKRGPWRFYIITRTSTYYAPRSPYRF